MVKIPGGLSPFGIGGLSPFGIIWILSLVQLKMPDLIQALSVGYVILDRNVLNYII